MKIINYWNNLKWINRFKIYFNILIHKCIFQTIIKFSLERFFWVWRSTVEPTKISLEKS